MTPTELTHISTAYERAAILSPPAWHPYPSTLAAGYRLTLTVGQFYHVRNEHSEYRAEYLPDLTGYRDTEFVFVHGDGSVVIGEIEVFCGVEESNG